MKFEEKKTKLIFLSISYFVITIFNIVINNVDEKTGCTLQLGSDEGWILHFVIYEHFFDYLFIFINYWL